MSGTGSWGWWIPKKSPGFPAGESWVLQTSCVWRDTQVGSTGDLTTVVISVARGVACQPFLQRKTNALPCGD